MKTKELSLDQISIDGGTQVRTEIDEKLVEEYAEEMAEGTEFPPLLVFDDGVKKWLVDGFHRLHAARRAGVGTLAAYVEHGTRREAVLRSKEVNGRHGRRLTNADKRKSVIELLRDPEWCQWSDREIARRCCCGRNLVGSLRLTVTSDSEDRKNTKDGKPDEAKNGSKSRKYVTKHGTPAEMEVGSQQQKGAEKRRVVTKEIRGVRMAVDAEDVEEAEDVPTEEEKTPLQKPERGEPTDAEGNPVPEKFRKVFSARDDFRDLLQLLRQVKQKINAVAEQPGGERLKGGLTPVLLDLDNLRRAVRFAMPHSLCPYCKASGKKCDACRETGWVPELTVKHAPKGVA